VIHVQFVNISKRCDPSGLNRMTIREVSNIGRRQGVTLYVHFLCR